MCADKCKPCPVSFHLLHVHGSQRQYLRPLHLLQLRSHDAVQSRPYRLPSLVDQDAGVVVELDHAPVRPLPLLRCAHYDGMPHISSSDLVRCADRHAIASLGAEVALLLDDDYDAVTCNDC